MITTFTGSGTTPSIVYDTRVLLYYLPISNLSGSVISGSATVKLQLSNDANIGTRTDYNLVLFNGGTATYPNVANWSNLKTNIARPTNYESQSKTTYFYLNNTNFTSQYAFYVNQNISLNFSAVSQGQTFSFDFEVLPSYRDSSLWNGNNIFFSLAPQNIEPINTGSVYWSTNSIASLELTTTNGSVYYYINNSWQPCEVYYCTGNNNWVPCQIHYYNSGWKLLG